MAKNGQPVKTEQPAPPAVMVRAENSELTPNNNVFLAGILRRLREIILEAQKRRADGGVRIDITFQSGNLSNSVTVQPRYIERITGVP